MRAAAERAAVAAALYWVGKAGWVGRWAAAVT